MGISKSLKNEEDFNFYCYEKSYNIAVPRNRFQIYNHPYLMCEPKIYIDYNKFEDQKLAQCQLMYFFMNGIVDY